MKGTYIKPDEMIYPSEVELKVHTEAHELLSSGAFKADRPLAWGTWCTEMCIHFLFAHGTDLDKIHRCIAVARDDQRARWSRQEQARTD